MRRLPPVSVSWVFLACVGVLGGLGMVAPEPAVAASDAWTIPAGTLDPQRGFDRDASTYGPGHRGLDLSAQEGDLVHAVAGGTVTWAGMVAGRPTITIEHGAERSTYEPVTARVQIGDRVTAGQAIGILEVGHSDCADACLHLGRIRGEKYLDPGERFGTDGGFRLISPAGPPPEPPVRAGSGALPVAGPVTSPFGMRLHPVTGRYALHDGADIGASCGTPVAATAAGRVKVAGSRGAYGLQVVVEHSPSFSSSFSHLSATQVRPGHTVRAGDVVGLVGTTGRSTGCHLHLMHLVDGRPTDPLI